MKSISIDLFPLLYQKGKEVFSNEIRLKDAVDEMVKKHGMNRGSATDYIIRYRQLVLGQLYTRTMNSNATRYYIEKIFHDEGVEKAFVALSAIKQHVEYYDSLGRGKLKEIRSIYKEYYDSYINYRSPCSQYFEEEEKQFNEGRAIKINVNVYERDPNARKKCIEIYGYDCYVCGIDMTEIYGEIASEFIHIHHLIDLSTIKKNYRVDPEKDLRPLCPNCHSMIHRRKPSFTIEELKEIIAKNA